ncbi:hypothetical protein AAMO2058_000298100 [Amorphochlora amoebiformis]|mmetsp:Transcript_28216/g.44935  ORF Transcript_28216/g.44935 Transcript_28216/m.44935 type:complete len:127 (-) Transcript_28216:179-559(-)
MNLPILSPPSILRLSLALKQSLISLDIRLFHPSSKTSTSCLKAHNFSTLLSILSNCRYSFTISCRFASLRVEYAFTSMRGLERFTGHRRRRGIDGGKARECVVSLPATVVFHSVVTNFAVGQCRAL